MEPQWNLPLVAAEIKLVDVSRQSSRAKEPINVSTASYQEGIRAGPSGIDYVI